MVMFKHRGPHMTGDCMACSSRPPKPPNWRDFLPDAVPGHVLQPSSDHGDRSGVGGGRGGSGAGAAGPHSHRSPTKTHRKKHRLHRTRSQFTIDNGDLPEQENMTLSLADTNPKELGLRKRGVFDVRLYTDENNRRCERWLAGVKASEPLEDVAFAQGPGVEVEIPEENWEIPQGHILGPSETLQPPPQNSSASSSDHEDMRLSPFSSRKRSSPNSSSPSPLSKTALKPLDEGGGCKKEEEEKTHEVLIHENRSETKENRLPLNDAVTDLDLDLETRASGCDDSERSNGKTESAQPLMPDVANS